MVSSSQRILAGGKRHAKNQEKGGKKQYKEKRGKESRQNKCANFATDPSPQRQPLTEDDLAKTVEPLQSLLVEASTLRDKITQIKALHTQWKAEDKKTELQGE